MGDSAPHLRQLLSTLRDTAAGPRARLRLHRIEALAARMAALDGPARAVLEGRLQRLLAQSPPGVPAQSTAPRAANGLPALSALLAQLRTPRTAVAMRGDAPQVPDSPATDDSGVAPMPALEIARQTWARLRMDDHLRHVMAEVPDDAGPMHSTVLVHRAIAVMHEAAPGYLQHFLGYADALAALERLCPVPAIAAPARAPRIRPPPAGGAGTRSRARGRRRQA